MPWSVKVRNSVSQWREIRGSHFAAYQIVTVNALLPITPLGDEFAPVGCICPCGETLVVVPERGYGCDRCALTRKRQAKLAAADVFQTAGLRLLATLTGENVKQPVECLTCGATRQVRYRDALDGSAPLCWTCTHGIRVDEPHRVYLFHFPVLGVYKVGITHNRHDVRLLQHQIEGGNLIETAVLPDRTSAREVETWVLAAKAPWRRGDIGPRDFPQGGWTEAWSDLAPPVNLADVCASMITMGGSPLSP